MGMTRRQRTENELVKANIIDWPSNMYTRMLVGCVSWRSFILKSEPQKAVKWYVFLTISCVCVCVCACVHSFPLHVFITLDDNTNHTTRRWFALSRPPGRSGGSSFARLHSKTGFFFPHLTSDNVLVSLPCRAFLITLRRRKGIRHPFLTNRRQSSAHVFILFSSFSSSSGWCRFVVVSRFSSQD